MRPVTRPVIRVQPGRRPRERGLTLVEMMIALTIGLGVALIAARLLLLANGAWAAQMEDAALDDGGRFALALVAQAVRQAGHVDLAQLDAAAMADAPPARLAGLDARSLAKSSPGIEAPLPDAANGSDVLAVRYPGAGAAPNGDGSVTGCAGFATPQGEEGWSIFYVARNADGEAELRCKYRGDANWSADAVVTGVDAFQVLYGIDTDTPRDGVPNRYVNAAAIDALDAALGLGADQQALRRRTHWKRVASVRVSLLLHGARPTRAADGAGAGAAFDLFGAGYAAAVGEADPGTSLRAADFPALLRRRERRLFTTTVAVPSPAL